jgi:HNH endonuclease
VVDGCSTFIDDKGYVRVNIGYDHPHNNKGLVYAHRAAMENRMNRYIDPSEVVHHIDENKLNNDIMNLFLCSAEEHVAIHNRGRHNSLEKRRKIRNGMQEFNRNRKIKSGEDDR